MLGDMGADVIKVERGEGDNTRNVDLHYAEGMSSYFLGLNRSKRSIVVDYRTPAGRDLLLEVAKSVDVIVENFRPGVMENFGLAYEEFARVNPRLIYCSISAFGHDGPLHKKAAMDLVVQAMGGVMGLTGDPDGLPMRSGAPTGDFVGAFLTVIGVTLGLLARAQTGLGQRVDVPLINGQVAMLANYIAGFVKSGEPSRAVGVAHPQLAPYQLFKTADRYLIIACLTEEFWRRLCRALKREELIDDARFKTNPDRVANRAILIPIIEAEVAGWNSADLAALLDSHDVPNATVQSLADVIGSEQIKHNEMVIEIEQRSAGKYPAVGIPVKLSATPGRVQLPAPELGEHTEEVLVELGVSAARIRELADAGVIRQGSVPAAPGAPTNATANAGQ
jgi:crotonobetainyl-CoA:carnitine CoA-transferase CaiB-like acyl-CoA transferase